MSNNKKIFILSIGQGLATLVSLAVFMIAARHLTLVEFAVYRQTLMSYQILVPLLGLGMNAALIYYLPTENDRKRGLVVDTLIITTSMGLICVLFTVFGGAEFLAEKFKNPVIKETLLLMTPLFFFATPTVLIASVLLTLGKVNLLNSFNVLSNLVIGVGVVLAVIFYATPESMIITRVAIMVLSGLAAIYIIFLVLPKDGWQPKLENGFVLFRYGFPLAISSIVGTTIVQLDKVIVSVMTSPEDFAIYANGAMEIPFIGIVTGSVCSILIVEFRKRFSEGDLLLARETYRSVSSKTSLILFPAMIFLAVCAEPFIVTLYSEKYIDSVYPFLIYLLIIPARTLLLGGLAAVGKSKVLLRNSIVSLVINATLSVFLVNVFGYIGAIFATIMTLYFWDMLISLYEISRSLKCKLYEVYPWFKILINFALALGPAFPTYIILSYLSDELPVFQLMACFMVYTSLYLALLHKAGALSLNEIYKKYMRTKSRSC